MRNNLDGEWWRGRQAVWENIDVPLYSAGNWSGMGLHLRGNTEGYLRAASEHKKLRIHAGTHYHPFYSEEGRTDQLRFFVTGSRALIPESCASPRSSSSSAKGATALRMAHRERVADPAHRWTSLPDRSPASDGGRTEGGSRGERAQIFVDLRIRIGHSFSVRHYVVAVAPLRMRSLTGGSRMIPVSMPLSQWIEEAQLIGRPSSE